MSDQQFVLIIEDAPEIAEIFSEILQSQGLTTQIVSDGAVALQILKMRTPSLILLDMHLPNVSGRDVLMEIRANPDLAKTKVIAVTADALIATSIEDMADLVLIKPVSYSQIIDLSRRMIMMDPKMKTAPLISRPEMPSTPPAAAMKPPVDHEGPTKLGAGRLSEEDETVRVNAILDDAAPKDAAPKTDATLPTKTPGMWDNASQP